MKLEALPAAKGDCLILHHRQDDIDRMILIDGGPSGVYKKTLKPRLLALREQRIAAGKLKLGENLFIDLVIISHIDDDHINGIKALLEDLAGDTPPPFTIGRIWHNGFDSLLGAQTGIVDNSPSSHVIASLGGLNAEAEADPERRDVIKVIASIGQGHAVVGLAKRLGISINPEFEGKAIIADDGAAQNIDGLSITVVGPLKWELDALRADFAKWLAKRADAGTTQASLLASFSDTSVANLSSLVLLVEGDQERYLLTGDARGDHIMTAVDQLGIANSDGKLPLNILKVQHHGSDRNTTRSFFEKFPAKRYILSGDGEHGNPERDTFVFMAAALNGSPAVVELTYSPEEIDRGRAADRAKHGSSQFDSEVDGIAALLVAHPNFTLQFPR